MISKVSFLEEGGHTLERADHITYITLEEFVSSKERGGCKTAVLEVWISWDISTIWDDNRGRWFHGDIIF